MNVAAPNNGSRLLLINTGVRLSVATYILPTLALLRTAYVLTLVLLRRLLESRLSRTGSALAVGVMLITARPPGGLVNTYATVMEDLAQNDNNFAATYGTYFYRLRGGFAPPSSRKRKNRPGPACKDSPDTPTKR
ncbi:hypothetical protein LZ30DRAFT_788091 [Colletotrichum cereale]|nr:hypothetical protein LZ30DRAFT_788091 [Colletotrichum cereale]